MDRTDSPRSSLVSVITPCYNAAEFVAMTIEAVRAQTYPAVEHIVVDDGSTDESWSVIASYGERIRAARLPRNRGGSHARNLGAGVARGAYLMFLDADDLIAPETIAGLVEAVQDKPGTIGVCRWHQLKFEAGIWHAARAAIPFPPPADALRGWLEGTWVPPCGVLWRRDSYERTGGWDEELTLNDDGDLMMRALVGGARLVVATRGEAIYRSHPPSRLSVSSFALSETKLRSQLGIYERLAASLDRLGRLPEYEVPLGIAYHRLALTSFQVGHREVARESLRRGKRYAGRQVLSRSVAGRLLTVLLGVEGKERVAAGLAHLGIMTRARRRTLERRRLHAQSASRSAS